MSSNQGNRTGVELVDLYALFADTLDMLFLQRLVVRCVAETVEEGTHLDSFFSLLRQQVEEHVGNGVVAEVEIFQVDAAFRLTYCGEHVVELLLSAHQQGNGVVARKPNAFGA